MKFLYTVQYNVMYKYTFYHALYWYSVRVSISYYVLHVAMLVLLITTAVSTNHTLLSLSCTVEQQHSDLGA